ncbi:MAG: serpin family protein [Verrucomicrobiaceae bacterium]|nr:serpin family protein [Verrucomicrobiaceae bacterium]
MIFSLASRIILVLALASPLAHAAGDPATAAVNHLGLALLRETKGNALVSPWSLQQALAMVYAGAHGKTRDEMTAALGYSADEAELHKGLKCLREAGDALAKDGQGSKPLRTANRLFVAANLPLKTEWLDLTKRFYGAVPQSLNFAPPSAATRAIDDWVAEQTDRLIPSVIPDGALKRDTKLVIANALYFDLPWDELFTKELTKTEPFFTAPGRSKNVPLMFKQHRQRYAHKDGFQIATLPYAGEQVQFVVVLPDDANDLAKVEAALTTDLMAECTSMSRAELRLTLPRLKMEPPSMPMKESLEKLGMKSAFSDGADLTGIWHSEALGNPMIDEIFHRTFVELDENGTKAAASTAVILRPKNGVPREVPHMAVRCDHPFVFAIQHVPTGACLFVGRVADPEPAMSATVRNKPKK